MFAHRQAKPEAKRDDLQHAGRAEQHRPAEHAREEAGLFAEGVARLDAAHQHVALGQLGQERLKFQARASWPGPK